MEILLKPGLAIINTKGLHSAVIQVGFLAGSRFDEKGEGSLAHLVEHLFVKELENASHHANLPFTFLSEIDGQVEKEMMWGYIKTAPSHMPEAMDRMMRSIYLNPLDASVYEKEKESISGAALQNEHNQDPYDLVFAKTYDLVFSLHPLARSEVGTYKASQALTMEDVSHHFQTRCRKGRKFIAIACDLDQIDLDTLLKPWETFFTEVAIETDKPSLTFPAPNPQTLSLHQDAGTVEMTLSVPIPKSAKVPFWLMDFVNYVLGKPPISLLVKLIREKYSLAYDTRSLCFHYTDGSLFIIYAGISNPENQTQAVERIEEILTHITSYLTETQLALYKQAYIAHYWMKSDHLVNFTRSLITTSLTQAPLHPQDHLAHIQSISLEDIEHFVSTYLHPSKLSRVIIR
jgi:predicted Zn-dependent peptidase